MQRRRTLTGCAAVWAVLAAVSVGDEPAEFVLWPDAPPGETAELGPERTLPPRKEAQSVRRLTDVSQPTLTWFPAPEAITTKTTVVVCPGGGYNILAFDKEGEEIARWFNQLGVSAAVLKYRVPRRDPEMPHEVPLIDAQRAMRVVRARADQWRIDPQRVGMLGFSAGGHLAAMTAMHADVSAYQPVDDADGQSARPNFLILVYAAYLGDKQQEDQLSKLVQVDAQTPPTFMVVTHDDKMRGLHAALLLAELKRHDVPAELHVFEKGGHGYALRPTEHPVSKWPDLCEAWLHSRGLIRSGE